MKTMGSTEEEPSYPTRFQRPSTNPNPPLPPLPTSPILRASLEVPLLNLQHLDPNRLGEACRNFGLFRLTNHGIPSSLSARLHLEAKNLLSLPFHSKTGGFSHPLAYFWGTPALSSSVKNLNWVEGLHVPLGQLKDGDARNLDGSYSFFRHLVSQYGQHMASIARTIFDALAIDLKLDGSLSASYLSESDGMLRVYRYPRCLDASNFFGMDAHTDSSVLSILNQDDVGGLQILHGNRWFDIQPIPDTLIVNLGDMMQAISDDEYKSVEHRVVANESKERISLCYFSFPLEDAVIVASKYRDFTYKEFKERVQEDIKAAGFKVGLERFKIMNPG